MITSCIIKIVYDEKRGSHNIIPHSLHHYIHRTIFSEGAAFPSSTNYVCGLLLPIIFATFNARDSFPGTNNGKGAAGVSIEEGLPGTKPNPKIGFDLSPGTKLFPKIGLDSSPICNAPVL